MDRLSEVTKWAARCFSLIPGIAIFLSEIGVPPGSSKTLYGAIVESAGILTIILLTINEKSLRRLSNAKLTRLSVTFFVLFLFFLIGYIAMYNMQVVVASQWNGNSVLFPFFPVGDLAAWIKEEGSKAAALNAYRAEVIEKLIADNMAAVSFTQAVFIACYTLIFESLVLAFSILSAKVKHLKYQPDK